MIVTQDELFEIAREAAPRIDGAWRFHFLRFQAVRSWSPVAVITDDRQPGRGIRIRRSRRNEHRLSLAGSLPPLDGRPGFTKRITVDPEGEDGPLPATSTGACRPPICRPGSEDPKPQPRPMPSGRSSFRSSP